MPQICGKRPTPGGLLLSERSGMLLMDSAACSHQPTLRVKVCLMVARVENHHERVKGYFTYGPIKRLRSLPPKQAFRFPGPAGGLIIFLT
jgi:hypothetical protein